MPASSAPAKKGPGEPGCPGQGSEALPPGGFLSQVLQLAAKDLRLEWRSREVLYTMTFFAVLVLVIFSFAFAREGLPLAPLAGGMLWVMIPFAGVLGLSRVFERERTSETFAALLLAPVNRAAIYLAKVLAVLLLLGITEVVAVPLALGLFGLQVSSVPLLLALLAAGTLGFAAVGCLLAAALLRSRSRDVLLGTLLFPIVTPLILAGAKGTSALMGDAAGAAGALIWLQLICVFDLVFLTLSLWVFGPLTRGE